MDQFYQIFHILLIRVEQVIFEGEKGGIIASLFRKSDGKEGVILPGALQFCGVELKGEEGDHIPFFHGKTKTINDHGDLAA